MNSKDGSSRASELLDLRPVCRKQAQDSDSSFSRFLGRFCRTFKEKRQPFLPGSFCSDTLESVVISAAMRLEVKAQIKEGFLHRAFRAQQKRYQQASQPAVSIEKGMDGLKLRMHKPGLHEERQPLFRIVEETFKAVQALHHLIWRRRHKGRVTRTGAANPVLGAAKFSGRLVRSASTPQQDPVNCSSSSFAG